MRSPDDVRAVFRLFASGRSPAEISHSTGVSMSTIKRWLHQGPEVLFASPRRRVECDGSTDCSIVRDAPHGPYAYLLGQYLGDGHIVRSRNVYRLEITCCATYPAIVEECADAIARVLPMNSVGRRDRPGVIQVGCYSKHLPCLFPQHGAGPKHQRPIVLRPWQEQIAIMEHPELFVRGLLHSDGCRLTNTVRGANGTRYAYPRYLFCNHSADIRGLFTTACDQLGVSWRQATAYEVSVARRLSVARLDEFVGPKS